MEGDVRVHHAPQVYGSEFRTRYHFHTRHQEAEENTDAFIAALQTLASSCSFDFLRDSLIRDRVVVGVRDARVRERLLQETSPSLERCIELCREMEVINRHWDDGEEDIKPARVPQIKQEDNEAECGGEAPQWDGDEIIQEVEVEMAPPALYLEQTHPDLEAEDMEAAAEPVADLLASSGPFTCTKCSVQFISLAALQIHTGKMHVKEERDHLPGDGEPGYSCACGQQFAKLQDFQSHACQVHSEDVPCSQSGGSSGRILDDLTADEIPARRVQRESELETEMPWKVEVLSEEEEEDSEEEEDELSPEEANSEGVCLDAGEGPPYREASTATSSSQTLCRLCQVTIATVDMARHLSVEHKQRHIRCLTCFEYFRTRKRFKDHVRETGHKRRTTGSEGYGCTKCLVVFATWQQHARHRDIFDHEVQHFKCTLCGDGFVTEPDLIDHMTADHGNHSDFTKAVLCECGLGFPSKDLLQSHKTGCDKVLCRVCGDEVAKAQIMQHVKDLCSKMFPCNACGETFNSNAKLLKHAETHFPAEGRGQCPICKKFLKTKQTLKQHLITHSVKRPFLCSLCGHAFKNRRQLQQHSRMHSGEKELKCRYCTEVFSSSEALQEHLALHTSEYPYECHACGQRFKLFAKFSVHKQQQHMDDKPFACEVCGKAFSRLGNLQSHWRTHGSAAPSIHLEGELVLMTTSDITHPSKILMVYKSI